MNAAPQCGFSMNIEKQYPDVYRFSFGEPERFDASVLRLEPPRAEKLNFPFGEDLITGEINPRAPWSVFPGPKMRKSTVSAFKAAL
ncbi:MAG: hypothetical protein LBC62_05060 [Treponema sp.]|jgi:hypothetical protein|nr:hypothetical protein [Treponema sp.]